MKKLTVAVILATPIPDHAEHVIKALNAGKHVLSEVISVLRSKIAKGLRKL